MKTNLTGNDAFFQMMEAEVPEKTESYTPISHFQVLQHLKKEIKASGCIIAGEDYRCTADRTYRGVETQGGQVAVGMVKLKYGADPDLVLTCAFLNSYNKQFAFRFAMGAHVVANGNALMLENNFRRIHTGEADIFTTGTITDLIKGVGEHWNAIIERKDKMKSIELTKSEAYNILGELYFAQDLLTGFQLNIVKKELARLASSGATGVFGGSSLTCWMLYNVVAEGIKDTHPAEWLDVHVRVSAVFNSIFDLDGSHTALPTSAVALLPGDEEEESDEEYAPVPQLDDEDEQVDEVA